MGGLLAPGHPANMSSDGMGSGATALPHSDGTVHLQGATLTPRAHAGVGEMKVVQQAVGHAGASTEGLDSRVVQATAGIWLQLPYAR